MSNDQPRDDDQANEPTVAEYQRADASKFPEQPAGQQAAAEGMAAAQGWTSAELIRNEQRVERGEADAFGWVADELNRRGVPTNTPMGRLTGQMIGLFAEFEKERRDRIIAAGGDPDGDDRDPLSRAALADLASEHRKAMRPEADSQQYDDLVEEIADTFTLSDVRIMRGAWTAVTEAMPRIAYVARQEGRSPDEIAQATGYTSSRIAQFIRQEKQRAAAPLTRYTFRVDVMGADGKWTDREVGDEELDPNNLPAEANRLIDESGARTGRARIFLWERGEGEGDDDAATHTVDRTRY
ncbi:hypothetical protein [Streptomyces sp. BSP1]|uniref:hypothetical protein n=1 Tax=Streptomyces sp. BSP1 TaxID=2944804 RepID=UPI00211EB255|nr:hypothetical protein [Streptomyces sp. BSP1]MCQ9706616.1 hypothetical protein [Streptomyces sp. BSP1]